MKPLLYPSELKYRLSFFDIETGQIKPILVTDRLIEAPNWHPDGTIILNCEGCLFEVNPVDPKLIPIPIQGLNDLNNDHGITPDGRSLIVSDSPDTGSSIIYTVPYSGGRPSQVTDASPSWWHGISPDGKTLAYTARRNGVFDIYSCPFEGGVEKRLTTILITQTDQITPLTESGSGLTDQRVALWTYGACVLTELILNA